MTDYTKATGSSGTMMIRDTGSTVEFWLKAGSATFNHQMPWRYYVNGAWSSYRDFDFSSGGSWQKLGSVSVSTDQTVGFGIGDTGTSGLGGPTSFTISVTRTSAPGAPGPFLISTVRDDYVIGDGDYGDTGGLPLDDWLVGWGTSSTTAQHTTSLNSAGYGTVTGLARGTWYYFWYKVHNAKGWSPYSSRTSAKTWNIPPAPTAPTILSVTQNSVSTQFSSNGTGGGTGQPANTGYELGYGTSSTAPTTIVAADGTDTISGLIPGTTYYIWARAKNSVGDSAWSARATFKTIAGARILVGGVWKTAVPYVRVAGVWKPATPFVKIGGLWKGTG